MKFFKLSILFSLLFFVFSCKNGIVENPGIIPQPNFISYQKGTFEINENTVIVIEESKEGQWIAGELKSFLKDHFNLNLGVSSVVQDNAIQLKLSEDLDGKEAYQLEVSEKGVLINASSYQSIFYGLQSLKQLLSPKMIVSKPILNYVTIKDSPEFGWRGMMLDVSRHFLEKDSVKKVIDILAMHKMNKFHWHLVDGIGWRIQIDKYPELTKKGAWRKVKEFKKPWEDFEATYKDGDGEIYGGYYTKDDIREIVAYAAERYIDVIPEIEMPGHSEAALQCYPEFICENTVNTGVYCAGNDDSFEFLQNIIDEVVALFPYDYLHIGGDEVGKEAWLNCKKCQQRMRDNNLQSGEELQSYFVRRMEEFIHSKGKKLIGWDEILEGGIPERATVMSWRGFEGGIEAANAGHDVVMSPATPLYFDYNQGKSEFEPPSWGGYNNLLAVYNFNPVPKGISEDKKHHILGGQANLWVEQIESLTHIQYMMLPRLSALSEALWTNSANKNEDEFIKKIDVHFDRLKALGYNFSWSALSPDYEISYDKVKKEFTLQLDNELGIYDIRYTLDGSEPSINSELYSKPIHYSSPITIHAQTFRNGEAIGFSLKKMFSTSFIDSAKITYINPYDATYSAGGDLALFNNRYANPRGDDSNWQGFPHKDFEIIIDLGTPNDLSYIGLNFFQHLASTSVMLPTEVTIAISKDGNDYQTVYNQALETIHDRNPIIKRIETNFEKQNLTFIKISAQNRGVLPDWHIRKGDAWIFVDEVSVR